MTTRADNITVMIQSDEIICKHTHELKLYEIIHWSDLNISIAHIIIRKVFNFEFINTWTVARDESKAG